MGLPCKGGGCERAGKVPDGMLPGSLFARHLARVPSAAAAAGQNAAESAAHPRNDTARTPTLSAGSGFAVSRSVLPRAADMPSRGENHCNKVKASRASAWQASWLIVMLADGARQCNASGGAS